MQTFQCRRQQLPAASLRISHRRKNESRSHQEPDHTTVTQTCIHTTDLRIYITDAVPPVHVVWNHVDADKLTTTNDGTFTSSSASLSKSTSVTDRARCNVIGC